MPRSVLVVDDDLGFRALVTRLLKDGGYEVAGGAGSVAEALALAVQLRPDAALVDVGLPDGNGFDLTRRLVALPWPIHVVLISSDPDRAFIAAARRAGAQGFLPKADLTSGSLAQLLVGR